jgi:redox-sensitive bicupin YhaK (pirin superfamily)
MKQVLATHRPGPMHQVGDGFPVRTVFSYDRFAPRISPFLLLDYAAPTDFRPASQPRGVGVHPHRGFETVTIAFQGGIAHRDSTGRHGVIEAGDVQWMTAGAGILHEEFHSAAFTATGGTLEMAQLWVNLPKAHKRTPPRYQDIPAARIPTVELEHGAGRIRVIAGSLRGAAGPASTFSPMNVWDAALRGDSSTELELAPGRTALIVLLDGCVRISGSAPLGEPAFAILDPDAQDVRLEADRDTHLLVLDGEPLHEPVVGYGPFVMNTEAEIREAVLDLRAGRFGSLTS